MRRAKSDARRGERHQNKSRVLLDRFSGGMESEFRWWQLIYQITTYRLSRLFRLALSPLFLRASLASRFSLIFALLFRRARVGDGNDALCRILSICITATRTTRHMLYRRGWLERSSDCGVCVGIKRRTGDWIVKRKWMSTPEIICREMVNLSKIWYACGYKSREETRDAGVGCGALGVAAIKRSKIRFLDLKRLWILMS